MVNLIDLQATTPSKIAIVPNNNLGDGLLILILVNNLQRNGHKVVCFNDYIAQLQAWFPDCQIKPQPQQNELDKIFNEFDVVITTCGSIIRKIYAPEQYKELAKKYVFISLEDKMPPDLSTFSESIIGGGSAKDTLVVRIPRFCKATLRLKDVVDSNAIKPPKNLIHRKYPKRVTIHPTSNSTRRNWPIKNFLKLAKVLKQQGWDPVICVAPNEWDEWKKIANKQFTTIADLAVFIYESGYTIGNDSGPGHLASCLKIPTLTIWKKFNNQRWRPGWFLNELIMPSFKSPVLYSKFWYYLVPVKKVMKSFQKLVKKYKMTAL